MPGPSKKHIAICEQEGNKCPVLHPGDLDAEVFRKFEIACRNYVTNKDIAPEKQTVKVMTSLKDPRWEDWVEVHYEELKALSLKDFLTRFKENFMPADWETDVRIELNAMSQGENHTFRDFAVAVQNKNSLLKHTDSHLDNDHVRTRIEAGMDPILNKRSRQSDKKFHLIKELQPWIEAIKELDDTLQMDRAERRAEMEAAQKALRNKGRDDRLLTEPSRKTNTSSTGTSNYTNVRKDWPPKLTREEGDLLLNNHGCLKCRKPYVFHTKNDGKCDFPKGSGYKPVTQNVVDAARREHETKKKRPIAALTSASGLTSTSASVTSNESNSHPVAAVMGYASNPAGYAASNRTDILSNDEEEDELSSDVRVHTAAIIEGVDDAIPTPLKAGESRAPLMVPHMFWRASCSPINNLPITFECLLDIGSHLVIIREDLVDELKLHRRKLRVPIFTETAMHNGQKNMIELDEFVKLQLYDASGQYVSKSVRAVISPSLCVPVLLGLPFLKHNNIVIDVEARTAIDKVQNFDLINPVAPKAQTKVHAKIKFNYEYHAKILKFRQALIAELKNWTANKFKIRKAKAAPMTDTIAAVRIRLEVLAAQEQLERMGNQIFQKYKTVFEPCPHTDDLPTDVYCRIKLKDASKTISTRSYSSPRKYREAWKALIQTHEEAGRIRPSNSSSASPSFLVPKSDNSVLPRWVNDYRMLNANTVLDCYPLPRVDDILADCAKGKIWSKLDMTNSFFQTRVHPDDIPLTAVTTPFGLYEWTVMPQGLKNAPPIHQRRMNSALRIYLGKFCHIYLDDIVIWSNSIQEHTQHIDMIMKALESAKLFCNKKKCKFFLLELDFLGHHISSRGIQPNDLKIKRILDWPTPKNSTDVRAFLGLVRYLATFLPMLAEYTRVLTPLTTKEAKLNFSWSSQHQTAFDAIKTLVVSSDCLTVIDHSDPENKIFVTCDASDWRTGGCLSFGKTWETARPVAYDSMQLNSAEQNYPIHEKELLAIIRALKKWRADLLGAEFTVYTDHRTLENFDTQRDLSRRQLRWQEFMSQYEMKIIYIRGEDNTVADALSRLPPNTFDDEQADTRAPHEHWRTPISAVLSISMDPSILSSIKSGYDLDPFCQRLTKTPIPGTQLINGLWYVGDRLVVPRSGDVRENLFRLAHDTLGHFGADKSYAALKDAYYWPNMRTDLEKSYIPSCHECQRNKSRTTKAAGPLHPLPIPEERGDSVALDFIGPLPVDNGFDCILSMTDRLGSDIRIIPTTMKATAEETALLVFNHWYCENGLPLDLVSDRDKLFMSRFWKALFHLSGVKLKLSSGYHPQTDGASERTNKTINQAIRFHVGRNQKGWVHALPRIRFCMMSTVNASTGYSGFQLRLGRSPRIIPPIIHQTLPTELRSAGPAAERIMEQLKVDVADARDNLLLAKLAQAHHTSSSRGKEIIYNVGDKVMLSTFHRRNEYKRKGERRVAKFFPRWDGPYTVIKSNAESSSYTLDNDNGYPYYASELKPYYANNAELFPNREYPRPGPVMTENGLMEHEIDKIIDSRPWGRGKRYLVRWVGYGPEDDEWLPGRMLEDCEALDKWVESEENGQAVVGLATAL